MTEQTEVSLGVWVPILWGIGYLLFLVIDYIQSKVIRLQRITIDALQTTVALQTKTNAALRESLDGATAMVKDMEGHIARLVHFDLPRIEENAYNVGYEDGSEGKMPVAFPRKEQTH